VELSESEELQDFLAGGVELVDTIKGKVSELYLIRKDSLFLNLRRRPFII
jgi:hypothetical protein